MKPERRLPVYVLVVLAIAGCEANRYEIEMTPNGKSMQRELTCWRERTQNDKTQVVDFPKDELATIAAAYDKVPTKMAGKHKFVGAFVGKMPNDVGGSGSHTHWNTTLGSVSAYVERFRGNDDLLADVEKRQRAADRLADLLQGWLASQLEGEPGFAKLREFLQNGLRRDLKNLTLYTWAYGVVSEDDEAMTECLVRVGQYLVERSYFSPDQLPAMTRAVQEANRDPARLLSFIRRWITSKMGIDEGKPIPKGLEFLSNGQAVTASINGFLRQTKDFERAQREWEREKEKNPKLAPLDPSEILTELVLEAFFPSFNLGQSDRLGVKLAATTEPFLTNGLWDDKAKQVHWSDQMQASEPKHPEPPTLLFAFWSKPDEEVQKASFGRVVLEGSSLGNYCLWYRGLSKQEAKEWDEFIASLRPTDGLVEQLRKFRFSNGPAGKADEAENDLASTPRELILEGLGEAAEE